MINLKADKWDIVISPEHGASIIKCSYEGRDILHPTTQNWLDTPTPFSASCFPLVPFSNRIENGEFEFEGRNVKLPPNHSDQAHVIHGNGWTSGWEIRSHKSRHCELVLTYSGGDWPWPFEAVYLFKILGSGFSQSLTLTNTGSTPMPAGLGFHPYFPSRETAHIRFKATGIWQANAETLPILWKPIEDGFDFSILTPVSGMAFDNCFSGWDGQARIEWQGRPDKINITGSQALDHAVFYTPMDQPFFCFEPVSHGNNALANYAVMEKGHSMRLGAGDSKFIEMLISVEV